MPTWARAADCFPCPRPDVSRRLPSFSSTRGGREDRRFSQRQRRCGRVTIHTGRTVYAILKLRYGVGCRPPPGVYWMFWPAFAERHAEPVPAADQYVLRVYVLTPVTSASLMPSSAA